MSLELIDRFENIAREYSDKTGVVYKGKSLTYRELSDFSTSIALHIRKYESETVVLLLEHGLDVVPAMLGALKSGRVYIPLDPSFPNSRIGEILEDSGSRLLLCNTENLELAQMHSTGSSMDIINMDDINIEEKNISYGGISNTDPAYIMYTSGSTGKPKGVVQNYKSICHFVQVLSESLLFSEKDNMALFSSYSHAVGILDILSTLLTGGTLYPYNVKDNLVVDSLISWLRKERITLYHSVPTLFRFIFNDPVDAVDSLRLVILGGEAVTKGDFDLYRKISREKCYFINLFGCSELLISTMHIMNVEMETKDSLVPIGEQVDGVDIQLLDNSENDVAAFNSGEIVYESDFLFSGYWIKDNNIESFQNIDICKTFKSGDLAQMDMNGTISYLGRKDFQIKIRGQRVEPGEIEYKLTTINEIDSAVVVSQNEELVAYVVLSGNCAHDRIRTYLGSVLPDYMIPVQFVELESIPLTPNGKVDRKALPVPDCNYIPEAEYVAPRNELEERLVEIWQDVLKVGKIGIYDNFFSLGGYSLKAAKLLSLISKNLKVDIAMKDIFANPTIESFSRCIRKTVKKEFLHIERLSDSKEYYPVSSAQLRSFILAQKENINTAYNISGSMIIEGELDKERFNRVFQTLVERHESFRTSFHIIEGEIVQKIDPDLLFKVEYNDISASENSDEDLKRTIQGSIREFDLAEAPLLKINLFRLSEDRHLFIHDTHHIISDGFSSGILVNEFIHLYNGGTLSPLRLQYKDYSHWENNMYESGQMEIQRNYWKKMFKTGSPLLTMPLDFTRPEHIDFSGDSFKFSISSERTTKIGKIVREENLTMNIFFYSLYVLLIGKYSGQDDIVVGSITANRNHDDLSGIIGMFANYLPVRNRIDSQMTFHDFLNGTKKRMLDVYGNGNYPFDKIVGEMEKILPVNRNPLFDTMMVFHNEGSESIGASEISNINFKPVHFAQDRSTLDLKLDVFNGLDNGLDCTFEYSTSLFKPETIKGMAVHFNRLLDIVLETPDILLSEIELFSEGEKVGLEGRREASTESGTKVMVCGTFTGEPVGEYMEFWGVRMDTPLDIEFTNYNQVFQQFHDENSGLLINNGINLLLVRFEDWIRDDSGPEAGKVEKLEKFYSEFTGLLQNTTPNGTWFIGLFPPSGHLGFSRLIIDKLTELTGRLEELTGTLGGFYPVDFRGIGDLYNIETVFDPVQDREGHIPFTEEYFAAMGTVIVRGIRSLKNAFKVIALDCDNTLWKGICGEEGATGVKVDGPFARLQEFLVKKHDEGMLLVLNSKNNEDDVWEVFHRNPGMVLRREHIVASRINWDRKSENLASLADELNLGIDSFIFIDDSQAECFEVMSNMPEVLAIHLPEDPSEIPKYLAHVWAFDNLKPLTEEDRKRSEMYLAEKRRKEVVASSGTLDDFIGTLELKVSMNLAEEDEVPRISQLTQRTNQFNLSTRRRSESEITGLIGTEGINVWTIRVCDRFGDYGLTGVVITEKGDDELILDTFLLSCRVLGRKVENLVLAGLKEYCAASGVKMIRADYRKTEKNTPVRIFFDGGDWDVISSIEERITYGLETNQVRGEYGNIDFYYGSHYPVIEISSNHHVSREAKEEKISGKPDNSENRIQNNWNVEMVNENDLVHRNELFPLRFSTGESIKRLPEKKTRLVSTEYFASRNETEEKLVEIWQEVLGIERIGIKDNFFDLGGHSLKATRVVSRISKVFEVETGLQDIFSNTTIENLSKVIGGSSKTEYRQIEILRSQNTYPVSNSQRRLWVLDQFEKDCTAYNMPATFILEGKLHVSAFEQAYSFMVERHESLRTAFVTEDGEPRQKILNNHSFEIKILDLRNSLDVEKEAKILAKKDLQTSFNLETGSLVRFTIIQIEDEKHLLLFNMHHIISDGWSINIFIKEFMITYNSFRDGQTPELSPLRIQYKDYSVWQNNLLDSSGMDIQREYWLEKLSGELPVLDLPADYIRPVSQTFNGNSLGFVLPKDINTGLNDLCRGNKASLFMLLHALVKVLFHRYTGQTDIILGSPIAGRGHEDLENQIGFYVNTLSLRDTIEGDRTFEELLASVKKTCTDAFDHQDYPFDRLVEELDIKRDMSRSPLFDVMVVLQNNETAVVEFDGLNLSPYNTENTISKFDMTYNFSETGEGLFCGIEYNTDIYSADRIKRMAEHLKLLISSVLESPESRIKDLEIIPEEERNLLLNTFNDTETDYPDDKTIIQLFEEQVEKTPDNLAVVFEDVELTYRELNEKANIVGHYLRDNYEIEPDDLVGILLDRSEKMIIALLGILKSGAAYVPLDPEYPVDRIDYMLNDSCPKVVLGEIDSVVENEILDINDVLQSDQSLDNPGKITNPNHLAYVIYTSGSTGKPKGTLLANSTVVNFIKGITEKIDFNPDKIVVSVTTFSFDIFVLESFLPLSVGQRIVFANKEQQTDPFALKDLIMNNQVNMIQTTPSRIKMLTSEESLLEALSSLSEIMIGGEAFPEDLLEILNKHCNGRIYNMYGPTETTVWSTLSQLNGEKSVNIGGPIANTQIYILDEQKNIVPVGVYGELHIAGEGISYGYLNREELTAVKFIDNPFTTGKKMFKTGDLARWLPDGNIEFLGRIDNQIKIRGFRIELGEIENSLLQHHEISSTVVVKKEGTGGDLQLIAYFVSDKELELSELRGFLKKSLPDYMIPSFFIHMETLPLTPNGKIDRKALPDVDGSLGSGVEYVAPENEIQEKLVRIWQDVLGIEKVGILDNFFQLGGHSLKATRVVSRISKELEVDIALGDLFESQTIETLFSIIGKLKKKEYKEIEVVRELEYYDVSNAQRRLWVLDQLEKDRIAYNMPAAFILEGKLKTDAFRQAYSFMIGRHESLRTVFVTVDGEPKQQVLKNPGFGIEIIDLRNCSDIEKEARVIAEKDLHKPFNLEVGPLVRFTLIKLVDEKYLLLFNMHHIISDGWSMNIFIREFLTCYNSFKEDYTPELTHLRIHYKDYSAWQNDLLDSSEMDSQREYWLEKLSGELPVLDLPADYIRPVTQTFNGNSLGFVLPKDINTGLNDLCRGNKASLFMMLQALVKVLFHRYTGQTDIILGSPIAGRVHEDLENQIGVYVNTLSLRDTIEGDLTFNEFLTSVKKTCTDAFDHQDYPFDRLVEDLDVKRDLSRSPLFDVMVVLQNNETAVVEFDGLNLSPYNTENTISKFDMTYNFSEKDGSLYCCITYNTDIYSEHRIERMGEHLKNLITSVLENPDLKIRDLEIIPKEEKNLILNVFNDTKTDYPSDKTIVNLFEEQVEKTPDNIAVVFEGVELTYRELNEKANIVGYYLRDNYKIEPDDLVGVLLGRSEKMIIVLLGILKSGGAYVPLDPEYPVDRVDYMLKDFCPKVVLGEKTGFSVNDIEILDINDVLQSDRGLENPGTVINPDNLAYVIYTSGSTGKPKGTLIEHKNVVRLLFNDKFQFDFSERDIWTIFHSFCFDFSVWEMYGALLFGGKAVVISKETARDPAKFSQVLKEQKVTVLNQTPTAFYNLSDVVSNQKQDLSVRYVIFGGEALSPSKLRFWHDFYQDCRLINMFGITETTVHVSYKEITEFEISNNISNLGKPIPTLSTYVLDENQKLLPIGVAGELCVAGEGVCRGYLNRDDLTLEKFIENPFNKEERLYRSGDSAYINESGELIYLGRIDKQVQLRGFRVELGEIENSIHNHIEINSSVVLAKKNSNGDKHLVAYYVSDEEIEVSKIRSFLGKSLPDYMVPSFFIHTKSLPLTANGKLNIKALPEPDGSYTTGIEYVAPRNEMEEKLVTIWQDVLGVENIGITDNFFDLGGHSLNAIKLISKINISLTSNIKLQDIYSKSTIGELSTALETGVDSDVDKDLKKGLFLIEKEKKILRDNYDIDKIFHPDYEDFYPLSKIQQGMVFFSLLKKDEPIYHDQFLYFLRFNNFNIDIFRESFMILLDRHSILRTSFDLNSFNDSYQIIHKSCRSDLLGFEDLSSDGKEQQENSIREYIYEDLDNKFMIINELLWRMKIFDLGDKNYSIVFSCHHAILDGWSVSSLMSELISISEKLIAGDHIEKKVLKADYKKYVAINLSRNESDKVIAFWMEYLKDYSRTRLPFNFSNKKINDSKGSVVAKWILDENILEGLRSSSKELNCTLKELLLSAHIYLLFIITGEKDIITGAVSHDRPAIEDSDKVLGCFLNTIPVRFEVENSMDIRTFVSHIKNNLRTLKENELFLSDIAEIVGDNNRDGNPLFDTIFNYTDFRDTFTNVDATDVVGFSDGFDIDSNEMTNTLFDLETSLFDNSIQMQIKYAPSYFYSENIETAYQLYIKILNKFITDVTGELALSEILEGDLGKYLIFNNTDKDYPVNKTISGLFEQQVERTPGNIALILGEEELTYRELNEKSNQLASLLVERGVRPADHVGIISERSFEMIIGMYAILKAGGTYVPIDPDYPETRKNHIIENSGIECMVQDKEYNLNCKESIIIDTAFNEKYSKDNLQITKDPNELAYIIYTSGSTGKPKGVMIKNHSIVNLINWVNTRFNVNESDRLLFITSMCFDLSVYDVFGILASGGSLVIAKQEEVQNPLEIFRLLKEKRITFWDSVPSTFNFIIDTMKESDPDYIQNDLRLVFMSGDWIPVNLPGKIDKYFPFAHQISLGGATEGTVWSIYYEIGVDRDYRNSIPYGKPIDNNSFYILDDHFNILPDGVAGELYIGGAGVASGYMNDDEKTKYSFVEDIFTDIVDCKMYRTGDYGRMLPDGNIEFLGRRDDQVKIRGFRIELGEIENALLQNQSISSALVGSYKFPNGSIELIAYYVAEKQFEIADIKSYLAEFLPDYMIPPYFLYMESFPLTPNGKIDRKALPEPDGIINTGVEYVAPRNEVEEKLVAIWQEILGIEKIGIFDNFFELGGHSLKVTRVMTKISKVFSVVIPLKDIFEQPTISFLSDLINAYSWNSNIYISSDEINETAEVKEKGSI